MSLELIRRSFPQKYRGALGNPTALRVLALWNAKAKEILPPELFSAQTPKSFKNGVLTLEVENVTIGGEINLKIQPIIKEVNRKLQKIVLRKVVFRVV